MYVTGTEQTPSRRTHGAQLTKFSTGEQTCPRSCDHMNVHEVMVHLILRALLEMVIHGEEEARQTLSFTVSSPSATGSSL